MQLLGRAGTIGAFVKRGEESGFTKITLRGNTPDAKIVIMRKIDVRNKSEWFHNGELFIQIVLVLDYWIITSLMYTLLVLTVNTNCLFDL